MMRLRACHPARESASARTWQISVRSAPENLSVCVARKRKSTSLLPACVSARNAAHAFTHLLIGDFRSTALRMLKRDSKSGIGMKMSCTYQPNIIMRRSPLHPTATRTWSRRPGRMMAGSRMSCAQPHAQCYKQNYHHARLAHRPVRRADHKNVLLRPTLRTTRNE